MSTRNIRRPDRSVEDDVEAVNAPVCDAAACTPWPARPLDVTTGLLRAAALPPTEFARVLDRFDVQRIGGRASLGGVEVAEALGMIAERNQVREADAATLAQSSTA